ncbi:hypothetical protein DdX_12812 [Ditylenchus destructor]|uniref:Uncharacterized protein n=1 Tax=Ditylenchus destructor TaxID=166010 RepID=A0AAD4MWG0_9BILA|nr:hypothetical protein DdX_12812 [Ditylenchus destructor]
MTKLYAIVTIFFFVLGEIYASDLHAKGKQQVNEKNNGFASMAPEDKKRMAGTISQRRFPSGVGSDGQQNEQEENDEDEPTQTNLHLIPKVLHKSVNILGDLVNMLFR